MGTWARLKTYGTARFYFVLILRKVFHGVMFGLCVSIATALMSTTVIYFEVT